MQQDRPNISNHAFKQLADENTPSPQLKKKVLSSTKFGWLLANTLDLFSVKAIDSIIEMINSSKSNSDF